MIFVSLAEFLKKFLYRLNVLFRQAVFMAKNISIVAIIKPKCKHYFLLFSSCLSPRYCYYPLGILFSLRHCDFCLIERKKPPLVSALFHSND